MNVMNPWVDRIRCLMEPDFLAAKLPFPVSPLRDLNNLAPEVATAELHRRLSQLYVPGRESIALAKKVLATALSHAMCAYPDVATYVNHSNMAVVPLDEEPPTWVITGLAGGGKTALVERLKKLFENPPNIQASEHCRLVPILGGIFLKMIGKVNKAEIYRMLANYLGIEMGESDRVGSGMLQAIRNELYRQGCMFILVDESQSLGSSKNAGAVFVNFIALLRKFGIPVIVVGNYSMVHGIFKQPSQHQQRILNDPSILLPDEVGDEHFAQQLQGYKNLCSEFAFDPIADANRIHFLTGGCSRALLKLLALAYREQRHSSERVQVDLQALEAAYESTGFLMHRQEIELLREHRLTGKRIREDLMNPFEPEGPLSAQQKLQMAKLHRARIAAAVARTAQDIPDAPVRAQSVSAESLDHGSPMPIADKPVQTKADVAKAFHQSRKRRPPPSVEDAIRSWA